MSSRVIESNNSRLLEETRLAAFESFVHRRVASASIVPALYPKDQALPTISRTDSSSTPTMIQVATASKSGATPKTASFSTSVYIEQIPNSVAEDGELDCNFDKKCCWADERRPVDELKWLAAEGSFSFSCQTGTKLAAESLALGSHQHDSKPAVHFSETSVDSKVHSTSVRHYQGPRYGSWPATVRKRISETCRGAVPDDDVGGRAAGRQSDLQLLPHSLHSNRSQSRAQVRMHSSLSRLR